MITTESSQHPCSVGSPASALSRESGLVRGSWPGSDHLLPHSRCLGAGLGGGLGARWRLSPDYQPRHLKIAFSKHFPPRDRANQIEFTMGKLFLVLVICLRWVHLKYAFYCLTTVTSCCGAQTGDVTPSCYSLLGPDCPGHVSGSPVDPSPVTRRKYHSAPKNFLSAPNGSWRFFTFLHQNITSNWF